MTPRGVIFLAGVISLVAVSWVQGDDAGQGTLEVRLTDHREAIGDFDRVVVRAEGVRLHPAGLPRRKGWMTLPAEVSADLRTLVGGSILLLRSTLEPREFDGVAVGVGAIEGVLKSGEKAEIKDLTGPIALRFAVETGKITVLTLDLAVIGVGDHPGHPYELHVRGAFVGPKPKGPETKRK